MEVGDAKGAIDLEDELHDALELLVELVGPAEDVGVVDRERTNPDQPRDLA